MIDIRDFGAKCDGVTDDAPAIQAAIRAASVAAPATGKFRGDVVLLPCAGIYIASTIVVDRAGVLEGAGGPQTYAGTEIIVAAGVAVGIHIVGNSATGSGEGAIIRGIKITSKAPSPGVETIGILANNRFRLSDCSIGTAANPFDIGIKIRGNHGDVPGTNANCWMIDRVAILGCKVAMHVSGVDANAGVAIAVAAAGPSGSKTWLFDDDSFLGNTYVGCHASGCVAPGGGFRSGLSSANNRSVFLGCYVEGGTPNKIGTNAVCLGGTMPLDSGGFSLGSGVVNRFQIGETHGAAKFSSYRTILDPKLALSSYCHATTPTDPNQATKPWVYKVGKSVANTPGAVLGNDGAVGWYYHRYTGPVAGVTHAIPWMWSDGDADIGAGHIWFPRGIHLGAEANGRPNATKRICVTSGSGPPTAGAWKQGDRILNDTPSVGEYSYWICLASGMPGTWKAMDLIPA